MKERPILFSGPMVRAILDGRKTQTRRVVKVPPPYAPDDDGVDIQWAVGNIPCPYGSPGDRLWVREAHTWITLAENEEHTTRHPDGYPVEVLYRADAVAEGWADQCPWRPSMFMPRWASRLTLKVTNIGVERLHLIDQGDARAEGFATWGEFAEAWDKINGKRAPWDSNPWVWVVSFEVAE